MESVAIAGGSGLVGTRLRHHLQDEGYRIFILTRDGAKAQSQPYFLHWDVKKGEIDSRILGVDHVINLSGAGIADARWTLKRKKEIIESRTLSTQLLISYLQDKENKLKSFINASAMGYYGDCGEHVMSEEDLPSTEDFLSEVCRLWEKSASGAVKAADSVSVLRISTVLSTKGGALPKMTQSIPFGLAPYFGDGKQYVSWIHIDDLCSFVLHLMKGHHRYEVFNIASQQSMSNKDFVEVLADVIRPAAVKVPTPAFALRLAMGEMSSVVLNSCRLSVKKMLEYGFRPKYPDLAQAVEDLRERNV